MSTNRLACMLTALVICLSVFSGCSTEQSNGTLPELLTSSQSQYSTVFVEKGEFAVGVTGTSSVFYPVRQDVMCQEKNMVYREILVERGETVEKGQALIRMDLTYSNADLAQWKLQLQRAKENLDSGKQTRESTIHEAKQGLSGVEGSEKTLAELAVKKLELELEEYLFEENVKISDLQAKINNLENSIANNVLKAPFDGVVEYVVEASKGSAVPTGRTLVRIYSPDTILFRAGEIADKLYYNMPVTLSVGRGNAQRSLAGVVVSAPNVLPPSANSNTAYIKLANDISLNELTNSVRYSGSSVVLRDVLMLDAKAVRQEDGKNYVNILSNGTVEKRFVVIKSNGSGMVWVMDGLKEGQKIIVD